MIKLLNQMEVEDLPKGDYDIVAFYDDPNQDHPQGHHFLPHEATNHARGHPNHQPHEPAGHHRFWPLRNTIFSVGIL